MAKVKSVASQLQKHDIFEDIKIFVDTDHATPDSVNIVLHLKEKEKGVFETKINVGDNQAELVRTKEIRSCVVILQLIVQNGGWGIRNIFGGGESVYTNFSFGNHTRAAAEVNGMIAR